MFGIGAPASPALLRTAASYAFRSYDRSPLWPGRLVRPARMAGELYAFVDRPEADVAFVVFRGTQGLRELAFWLMWNLDLSSGDIVGLDGEVRQGVLRAFYWLWHGVDAPARAVPRAQRALERRLFRSPVEASGEPIARAQASLLACRSVCFVGHSLGGTIAALAFAAYRDWSAAHGVDNARLITFGAPRLGDAVLQRAFDAQHQGRYLHVVDAGDPIPELPPRLNTAWRAVRHPSALGAVLALLFPVWLLHSLSSGSVDPLARQHEAGRHLVGTSRRMRFAHHFSYFDLFG